MAGCGGCAPQALRGACRVSIPGRLLLRLCCTAALQLRAWCLPWSRASLPSPGRASAHASAAGQPPQCFISSLSARSSCAAEALLLQDRQQQPAVHGRRHLVPDELGVHLRAARVSDWRSAGPASPAAGRTPFFEVSLNRLGFLMPFLCCLYVWLCAVWFFDLAMPPLAGRRPLLQSQSLLGGVLCAASQSGQPRAAQASGEGQGAGAEAHSAWWASPPDGQDLQPAAISRLAHPRAGLPLTPAPCAGSEQAAGLLLGPGLQLGGGGGGGHGRVQLRRGVLQQQLRL